MAGGEYERKKWLNGIIKQNKSNEGKQEKMLGRKNIHNRDKKIKRTSWKYKKKKNELTVEEWLKKIK